MKSLQDSKKVLVVTGGKPSLDKYLSTALIAKSLKSDKSKNVHIATPTKIASTYTNIMSVDDIKVLNSLPPKKFVLDFKEQKGKVKNIQWNQEADNVSFFISMEEGEFNSKNMNFRTTGSDYETIILVGIKSLDELGGIYSNSKEVFKNVNIISVGGKPQSQELKINSEIDEKHSSVSEDTYTFLQKNSISMNPTRANALLAGIFSATGNFKKNISDPRTFMVCADLMKSGATNEVASKMVAQAKPPQTNSSKPKTEGKKPEGNTASQFNTSKPINQ